MVLGAHSLGARESSKQKLEVQSYIRHPGFQVVGDDTDLMLLKVEISLSILTLDQPHS